MAQICFVSGKKMCWYTVFPFLIAMLSITPASLADDDWRSKYQKIQKFGDVYVVKSVYSFCNEYETWLTDTKGNLLTPALRDIGPFFHNRAEFVPKEGHDGLRGLHGYIDQTGRIVIPAKYHSAGDFRTGKTWVIYPVDSVYGMSYLDLSGVELYRVPVELFPESFKIAKSQASNACNQDCIETLWWSEQGKALLLNHELSDYTEKRVSETKGAYVLNYAGKFGFINQQHILKTPVVLDSVDFSGKYSTINLQRVLYKDRYGFVDRSNGEVRIVCQFEDTKPEHSGLFWVKKGGKWGCIDTLSNEKISFRFDFAGNFAENGLAAVQLQGRFGHVDTTGALAVPAIYDQVSYFNNGLAMVKKGEKFGYADAMGNLVFPLQFDKATPFTNDGAVVEKRGLVYKIHPEGSMHLSGLNSRFTFLAIVFVIALVCVSNEWFSRRRNRIELE